MELTPQAHAVLLLNVRLGKSASDGSKPLKPREWAQFADWLKKNNREPSALLKGDFGAVLKGWEHRDITRERLRTLLDRGAALGLSLERWERAGLWVLTRSDPEYPKRLKRHLDKEAPAVLFGCGDKAMLEQRSIAVVGSRNAGEDGLEFAGKLGAQVARQNYSLVSGGARGIDWRAMGSALKGGGTALGVLADNLFRSAMAADYRQYILSGNLALISPFNPEARFHVGNAMARNAYIYCLADSAVVVSSESGKGGTWSGAQENLKKRWVPLWVKPDDTAGSGNRDLIGSGAQRFPLESFPFPLSQLVEGARPAGQDRLPLEPAAPSLREEPEPYASAPEDDGLYALFLARMAELTAEKPMGVKRIAECLQLRPGQVEDWLQHALPEGQVLAGKRQGQYTAVPGSVHAPAKGDFYALFVDRAVSIASTVAKSIDDISERLGLRKGQARDWLKLAVAEGRMVRKEDPVRYLAAEALSFGDNA